MLTAVDVTVLSIFVGVQQLVLPDATQQVRETLERVEALQQDMEHRLEEVRRLKAGLEAAKARAEEQQQNPMASRLVEALEKVHGAQEAVEIVFSFTCDACAPTAPTDQMSVRQVAQAFREVGDALDTPGILSEPLGSMHDEQFDAAEV